MAEPHQDPVPERKIDLDKLKELLGKGLDPNLEYHDATAALEAIGNELQRQAQVQQILAEHQLSLGTALITAHAKIIEMAKLIDDGGVREAAELYRAEGGGQHQVMVNRAPLIHPGGHPLRKG
jgi:hypothetical protein